MNLRFRHVAGAAWLALAGLFSAAPACSTGKTLCDLKCECEACNARTFDACVVNQNEDIARAEAYGCGDEIDAVNQCYMNRFGCDKVNDVVTHPSGDECADQQKRLFECLAAASDLM